MQPSLRISVIIPLYNKEPYIERAVNSVFAQELQAFEIIVVDDGSTDGGAKRITTYFSRDKRLRIVEQPNAGAGAARNRGISEMRGEIAAFLDADDEWLPNHLSLIGELAIRFPEAGWFATGYRSVFPGTLIIETTLCSLKPVLEHDYFRFSTGTYPVHMSSVAVRKSLLASSGGFAVGEPLGEDLEFFARLALRSSLGYDPTVSALYFCVIPQSALGRTQWACKPPLVLETLKRHENATMARTLRDSVRHYTDWMLLEHAFSGLSAGHGSKALKLLKTGTPMAPLIRVLPASVIHLLLRLRRRLRQSVWFPGSTRPTSQVIVKRLHRTPSMLPLPSSHRNFAPTSGQPAERRRSDGGATIGATIQ